MLSKALLAAKKHLTVGFRSDLLSGLFKAVYVFVLLCKVVPAQAQSGLLLQLIETAQARHPSVQAQQLLASAADAGLAGARWQYYPTPSVTVQRSAVGSNDPLAAGDRLISTVGLSQPLWTWGRLEAGVDKAQAQRVMVQASQAEAMQQIALRVTQTYGEWRAAQQKSQAYSTGLQQQERLSEQVRRRIEEGQAATSDQALASGRQAAMRADLTQAELQARSALARLSVLVGQPLQEAQLGEQVPQPWLIQETLPGLLARLDDSAPSLARLQAQVSVLEATVREQEARYKPELQARFEVQQGNATYPLPAAQHRAYLGVATQFGAGLSNQSAVQEALARRDSAQADWQTQRLALHEQANADHYQISAAASRRADLIQSLESATGVVQSWSRQYLAGRKTWQDLMNSVREEVQLRAQIADFDAAQLIASWRLALLTGLLATPTPGRLP